MIKIKKYIGDKKTKYPQLVRAIIWNDDYEVVILLNSLRSGVIIRSDHPGYPTGMIYENEFHVVPFKDKNITTLNC